MPRTPVIARTNHLNASYQYVPNKNEPERFSDAYIRDNYFQNYIDRGNKVISFLLKQPWVDKSKFVVAGHSQGSKVAVKLATQNKEVTHLGLLSPNPFGRIDQMIREQRDKAESGEITWEEAEEGIAYWNTIWERCAQP